MKNIKEKKGVETSNLKDREEDEPPSIFNLEQDITKHLQKNEEPERESGVSFFSKKNPISIFYKINNDDFKINISDETKNASEYRVHYSGPIFASLGEKEKKVLVENFTYCKTLPLTIVANPGLSYSLPKPFLKNFVDFGFQKDLPRIATLKNMPANELLKKFNQAEIIFENNLNNEKIIPSEFPSGQKFILSLSFGKDSLLSYALLKEIKADYHLVFIDDMEKYNPKEFKLKNKIIDNFSKEQKEEIIKIFDDTDTIFRQKTIKNNIEDLDCTNAMLAFALELIPVNYYFNAKYLIFGNEKNLDDSFVSGEKMKIYYSFDQSSDYMIKGNQYLKELTKNNFQIVSLIKPLYNIAEMRIIYHRYPYLLKYLMSCSSDKLKNYRWCENCPTCVWAFLYATAVGDPKKIGLRKNFFEKKYLNFYRLFNPNLKSIYDKPTEARDEQLLAFYLANKNGYRGYLINLFRKLYLKEAEKREKELRKKFFGIHDDKNLPPELKEEILKIYRAELKDLIC